MFFPVQIDPVPGFGFQGGPEFNTNIKSLASGREKRNADWSICRHKYSAPFQNITNEAYLAIKKVHLMCRGRLHSFLHRDWADFSASDEQFAVGDGSTVVFQLSKISTALGAVPYVRQITKIDNSQGEPIIKVNGVVTAATVNDSTGQVTFSSAPATGAVLTWSGLFFVQVRFDTDYLPFSLDNKSNGDFISNGSIDLLEVLAGDD